jgi:hypothetical protein
MEVKIALASSMTKSQLLVVLDANEDGPLSASDSEGMILFFEGVDGPPSSIR